MAGHIGSLIKENGEVILASNVGSLVVPDYVREISLKVRGMAVACRMKWGTVLAVDTTGYQTIEIGASYFSDLNFSGLSAAQRTVFFYCASNETLEYEYGR